MEEATIRKIRKHKFNPLYKCVYVEESSLSPYERTMEHMDNAMKDTPKEPHQEVLERRSTSDAGNANL